MRNWVSAWIVGSGTCLSTRSSSGAMPWSDGPSGAVAIQPERPEP